MHVLIIGGTVFLGRHLVEAALARGDDVTLLHRGRHAAHRPDEVEEILGDRGDDLDKLAGRRFDALIDTCGYLPRHVEQSARMLETDHYTFVSSGSVYADLATRPVGEDSPLHRPPGREETQVDGPLYGPQKAGCEQALLSARPEGVLIQRAGLIVGPYDPTDRFTYWAARMGRPGPALAPDIPLQPVQFIDARDLAAWTLDAASAGTTGTMNANGPRGALTFQGLLRLAGDADIAWIAEQALLDAGIAPWTELPLWLPEAWELTGMMDMSVERAQRAGLRTRPVTETLADTAAWAQADTTRIAADYGTRAHSAVLDRHREQEILASLPENVR